MTMSTTLLNDAFDRINQQVHAVLDGLTEHDLTMRIGIDANTIGWLTWHLTRIQDDHIADAAGIEQVWTSGGWSERFGLPFDVGDTGYGQSSEDVEAVSDIGADQLRGYFEAVHDQTIAYVAGLKDADLERVVDTRWDPPVTLATRLVSVIADDLQHIGQAAFVRGFI